MRRSVVVAIVLLAIAFVSVGGPSLFTSPTTSDVAPAEEPDPEIVSFEDSESGFWPYLNARESFEKRSPINVVVRGETDEIVRLLVEESAGNWTETDEEHEEAEPATHSVRPENETGDGETTEDAAEDEAISLPTETAWGRTTGATRYAYVDPGDGSGGRWVTETIQLHDGTYYGQRYHIRLYESPNPDDRWVVVQTHTEHFDWFTLRHRVDGAEAAQSRLERDLMALPQVDEREDVRRMNLGNSGPSDANGWATVVELASMAFVSLVAGAAVGRDAVERARAAARSHLTDADRRRLAAAYDRLEAGHLILVMTVLALLLGVRIGGIALERNVDFLSMHAIAALLYPFVGLGIPAATYLIASGLERRLDAAVTASLGLALAVWLDYGLLGVDSLPLDVVLQRMLVVVALGLIAGGAARRATRESRWNDMLIAGAAMWILVLVGTLFGYL